MRRSIPVILLGLLLVIFAAMPVGAADNAKFFVCKYTTTPEGDEVLQTGQNPISVSANAIPLQPVVIGGFFADAQGRSLVLEEDIGQVEPSVPCPEVPPPPGTPTPAPSLSAPPPSESIPPPPPSESAAPPPSEEPPGALQFSVSTCPTAETASTDFLMGINALVIPDGMSAIRFSVARAALLITQLNVRIDGVLLTLENTLGDGTVGDRVVTPGVHTWSISNAADTEVLAEGEILCPVCNDTPAPPVAPVPDTALPVMQGAAFVVGLALMALGSLLLANTVAVRRRR